MRQEKYLPECLIREYIAAKGTGDWQMRLGQYTVVLWYANKTKGVIDMTRDWLTGRKAQRLIAVVYCQDRNGDQKAVTRVSFPAWRASVTTDFETDVKIFGFVGRLHGFAVSASSGPSFIGGKWGRVLASQPISEEERQKGVTPDTKRWTSM